MAKIILAFLANEKKKKEHGEFSFVQLQEILHNIITSEISVSKIYSVIKFVNDCFSRWNDNEFETLYLIAFFARNAI